MCVGLTQYQLDVRRVEAVLQKIENASFSYPTKSIHNLNPKSYHINLWKKAVIIPQQNPSSPKLATFGWMAKPAWKGARPFPCYNVRVEGGKSKNNPDNLINYAGAYNIKSNYMVRHLIKDQRCIIPVDSFIEQPHSSKDKRKFIIQKEDQSAFHLAGIYNEIVNEDTGEIIDIAFTILTTPSTAITQKVEHQRSPLVLEDEHLDFYLNNNTSLDQLESLYIPPSSEGFIAYEVDPIIAKRNIPYEKDDSKLIEPIGERITA